MWKIVLPASVLCARRWVATSQEEKHRGQSSSGCGRTRGGAKLWSNHVVFGITWEKGMLFLPVFTCFLFWLLNGLIGLLLRVQREEMKAKTYNCFRLLSLSSDTALGLGTAGSQPDLQPDFPSALCCRFIHASAFWSSSPSPLSASLITRWFLQPVFSQQLGQL